MPRRIFCDEAGFTGNRMLDADQTLFTYSSVALDPETAGQIVADARAAGRIQAPEIKGAHLMRSSRGRAVALNLLRAMRGSYLVTAYDKKLSLACKFFEYIFEPVLAANNRLFYENDFHKFIATVVYVNFICREVAVGEIVTQFERFMRSLNPADAPILFATDPGAIDIHPSLQDIVSFTDGYRDIILDESRVLGNPAAPGGSAADNWVLDLTLSALWSHLGYWGDRHDLLDVLCDDSKPLRASASVLNVMINRPDRVRVTFGGKRRTLTFNMARPVAFGSSSQHPGLQLADVASSAFMQALKRRDADWSQEFLEEIEHHVHEDCILPDYEYMDLTQPKAAVNALILRELGQRAIERRDPLEGMDVWYAIGHDSVHGFLEEQRQRNRLEP
jgi:hypothetical protein